MVFFTRTQLHLTLMNEVNVGSPRIVNLSGDHKGRREYREINSNFWNSKLDEASKNKETVWLVGVCTLEFMMKSVLPSGIMDQRC